MKLRLLAAMCSVLALQACSPVGVATGVGATVGVAAAQEGGLGGAATDVRIRTQINDLWFRSNVDSFLKLGLTVDQGRVLVTGVVQNPEDRVEAIRLAWQPSGVKQVINEVQVANSAGIVGYARDSWISTRLRTAMMFDRNIQSINYSIDTVKGVVYLIGTARNQTELNHVIEKARTIPDVQRVVSYVKMAGQEIETGSSGQVSAEPASAQSYEPIALEPSEMNYNAHDYGHNDTDSSFGSASGDYGTAGGAPQSLIESEPLGDY